MPGYYIYFISSLPMLHFGMKPPFSFEKLLRDCRGLIPDEDITLLENLPSTIDESGQSQNNATVKKWLEFDTALRNELVKMRAHTKKIDAEKFLRPGATVSSEATAAAVASRRNPSILEAEKILDEARWQALNEFSFGHYFDLDFLIIYAYKLKILERWKKINLADQEGLLKEVLGA